MMAPRWQLEDSMSSAQQVDKWAMTSEAQSARLAATFGHRKLGTISQAMSQLPTTPGACAQAAVHQAERGSNRSIALR